MDPITLATITSALTLIATEATKGVANEAGKSLWSLIKSKLGWTEEPPKGSLAQEIATKLSAEPKLAAEIVKLLQSRPEANQPAAALVQGINAEKVVVVHTMNVEKFEM